MGIILIAEERYKCKFVYTCMHQHKPEEGAIYHSWANSKSISKRIFFSQAQSAMVVMTRTTSVRERLLPFNLWLLPAFISTYTLQQLQIPWPEYLSSFSKWNMLKKSQSSTKWQSLCYCRLHLHEVTKRKK